MRAGRILCCILLTLLWLRADEVQTGPSRATSAGTPQTIPPASPPPGPQPASNDGVLILDNVPPSPSTATGERIWQPPVISHWPVVIYGDEQRNCAFRIEIQRHGIGGSIGWEGGEPLAFVLPTDERIQSVSGLLDVPGPFGLHTATLRLGGAVHTLRIRLADARQSWPHTAMVEGFPVDGDGVPVVLVTARRDFDRERRYELFKPVLPRPTGRPLLVGDPLSSLGADSWEGLEAERRPIDEIRYPHHAALVALATLPDPLPNTVVWSPGNNVTSQRAWSPEETRLLEVVHARFEQLGKMPRLVLVLPPVPLDAALQEESRTRRETLRKAALRLDWTVLDVDTICGPAIEANRVAEGLFTRYPQGESRIRLRDALARTLAP